MDPSSPDAPQGGDPQTVAQQDLLRGLRSFVSLGMQNFLGDDQTYSDTDAMPYNPAGQWTVYSPATNSTAVEGQPFITTSANGQTTLSPLAVLLLVAGLAFLVMH